MVCIPIKQFIYLFIFHATIILVSRQIEKTVGWGGGILQLAGKVQFLRNCQFAGAQAEGGRGIHRWLAQTNDLKKGEVNHP